MLEQLLQEYETELFDKYNEDHFDDVEGSWDSASEGDYYFDLTLNSTCYADRIESISY